MSLPVSPIWIGADLRLSPASEAATAAVQASDAAAWRNRADSLEATGKLPDMRPSERVVPPPGLRDNPRAIRARARSRRSE
jgi:hypothetical protein